MHLAVYKGFCVDGKAIVVKVFHIVGSRTYVTVKKSIPSLNILWILEVYLVTAKDRLNL